MRGPGYPQVPTCPQARGDTVACHRSTRTLALMTKKRDVLMPTPDARRIDTAAALLTSVGRADTDPGTGLHCLLAAEHLRVAGADPSRWASITADTVEQVIRAALGQLALLPPDVFATDNILAAAEAAQTALERAEDARAELG